MNSNLSHLFDAIFFDLDGTLIDSAADIATSVNHVRTQMNLSNLSLPIIQTYIGDGVRILLERALKTTDPKIIDQALSLMQLHYNAHCLNQTRLYPNILNMLQSLASHGFLLAVITNKLVTPSEKILSALGVRDIFSVIVGGDTTPSQKPEPEPFRFAAQTMNISSKRILVIGDSPNDILGARNAGYQSCGVSWGIGCVKTLLASQPNYWADNPNEILRLVIPNFS